MLNRSDSAIYYATIALKNGQVQKNLTIIQEAAKLLATTFQKVDPAKANTYLSIYAAAKDSLYNNQKLKQLEAIKLNQQKNQFEVEKSETAARNRLIGFVLIVLLVFVSIFVVMLWRNNRFKQLANTKLEVAYENLKSTQAQLIQSEKMASLGELTAGIAHEIQNPLNFVNNFSEVNKELLVEMKNEMSKGNLADAEEIANDVIANEEKINHHGKRANNIVKGMLQHSRTNKGEKEPTDINALADEYLRLAYQGLRAKDQTFNATIKTDFDASIEKISIIPQDIGRVLLNLYNNAFYAVAEKKRATDLEGFQNLQGLVATYQPTVSVSTKRIVDKFSISVKDNGNGIPQKLVDKIFQPFFTTKPTGQGTGLGLSLSYDIIKAHGGEIKVETKVDDGNPDNFGKGEGTEFILLLPIG